MSDRAAEWKRLLAAAAERCGRPVRLMEVCGSHSAAIARWGLRSLLPESVQLLSGPGCPVCVSGAGFIDRAIALCRRGVRVALFGDLLRVPGRDGATLGAESSTLVIYSPAEALDYALAHPGEEVVLAAVGFEPTTAATAAMLERAAEAEVPHFSLLTDFKFLRPALDTLIHGDVPVDGFLLPGHVAAITGRAGLRGLTRPGVIAGFAPEEILHALTLLLTRVAAGDCEPVNDYPRAVPEAGNPRALAAIDRFFENADGEWRGLGVIPGSCRRLRPAWRRFDAAARYELPPPSAPRADGCRCGDVLRGVIPPEACARFGRTCTPEHPGGACMVSIEGACAAAWLYRGRA